MWACSREGERESHHPRHDEVPLMCSRLAHLPAHLALPAGCRRGWSPPGSKRTCAACCRIVWAPDTAQRVPQLQTLPLRAALCSGAALSVPPWLGRSRAVPQALSHGLLGLRFGAKRVRKYFRECRGAQCALQAAGRTVAPSPGACQRPSFRLEIYQICILKLSILAGRQRFTLSLNFRGPGRGLLRRSQRRRSRASLLTASS